MGICSKLNQIIFPPGISARAGGKAFLPLRMMLDEGYLCCLEKVYVEKERMRSICKREEEREILCIWDPAVLKPDASLDFLVIGVKKYPFTSAI